MTVEDVLQVVIVVAAPCCPRRYQQRQWAQAGNMLTRTHLSMSDDILITLSLPVCCSLPSAGEIH